MNHGICLLLSVVSMTTQLHSVERGEGRRGEEEGGGGGGGGGGGEKMKCEGDGTGNDSLLRKLEEQNRYVCQQAL